jgi:hypothetical protein
MTGAGGRFDPSELRTAGEPDPSIATLAGELVTARELEGLAAADGIRPGEGFDARVMAAVATELAPRAIVRSSAGRGGRPAAFLFAVRDAWGIASTRGRPIGVRAQALAFVLVVLVAAGSVAAAGAVGLGGLLSGGPIASPSFDAAPSTAPNSATPTTPRPSESAVPSADPMPGGGAAPTATPGSIETTRPKATPRPDATPRPIETPRATETPRPTETPESSDDGGGGGSGGTVPDPD